MSSNFIDNLKEKMNLSSSKEIYNNFKEDEAPEIKLEEYPISMEARANSINWIKFLCSKLSFSDQTLFRTISIFDQYICKMSIDEIQNISQNYINLITIACLSLSTKLEEINCNYINFLNENVLNPKNEKIFKNEDLTRMEIKILKALKYKIIYSTPLDFIDIYSKAFEKYIEKNKMSIIDIISDIKILSITIIKDNINNCDYLFNSSSNLALFFYIQAFNQIIMAKNLKMKEVEKIPINLNFLVSNIF
jgi:hypothetical protein